MTNPTPRTRRQLRAALESETAARVHAEMEIESIKAAAGTDKRENTRLRTDIAAAETALNKFGFERSIERSIAADLGLVAPHEEWQPKQGLTPTLTSAEHEKILDQRVGEAIDATRASTLQAVITALKLTEYGHRESGAYLYPGLGLGLNRRPGHERLWADIQTALEVREEKRAAEERAATEKKVAQLAPAQQLSFFFPRDSFDVTAPRMSDLPFSSAFAAGGFVPRTDLPFTREDIENVRKAADDLGVSDAEAFTETVQKFTDSTGAKKQSAKEKPTKKKSEGKK